MIQKAAALLAFALSPAGRVLGAGLLLVAALGYGYMKGQAAGAANCEADALRARIAVLEADLDIAKAAADTAERQSEAIASRSETLTERLRAYESSGNDAPDVCRLTGDDIERLRNLTR